MPQSCSFLTVKEVEFEIAPSFFHSAQSFTFPLTGHQLLQELIVPPPPHPHRYPSSPPPPSGNCITPSKRSMTERFPTSIPLTSHCRAGSRLFASLLLVLPSHTVQLFPPLLYLCSPLCPSLHSCSARSRLITNKKNPFGAAFCCLCDPL